MKLEQRISPQLNEALDKQIAQVCEVCPSQQCYECTIVVRTESKRIVISGMTRMIEEVERIPNFV